MEKTGEQNKPSMDELAELAQALICCAGTDIYIVPDEKSQYANSLLQELTSYTDIAPEQLVTLSRMQNLSTPTPCARN
ncbi:MAG: hypothetical protein FJ023_06090 [Chloroflexi bacterium]|nr:hypothetical protein [Chloroflexota bacterium]